MSFYARQIGGIFGGGGGGGGGGVTSLNAETGDVVLVAGTGISVTPLGQNITIDATGGTGDVVGPASATDNAIARYDGTTGKLIQNSTVIVDDSGNVTGAANITATGATISGLTASQAVVTDGSKNLASLAYGTASSASSLVERDANQNAFANSFTSKGTNVVSAGGTTTLTAASARIQNLTGSSAQTFVLPDATTLTIGARFEFDNNSSGLLSIQANGGGALGTIPSGGYGVIKLTANVIAAGVWDLHYWIPGSGTTNQWGTTGLTLSGTLNTSGTATLANVIDSGLTASTVPYADASKQLTSSAVTPTELGYVSGVTSSIQTQLNAKGSGTVTSVTGTAPVVSSGGATPAISMAASTNSVDGYLTAADHTTFAGKQAALSSTTPVSHQFLTGFTAPNTFAQAQPAFTDISGTATVAQTTVSTQALGTLTTTGTITWSNGSVFTATLTSGSTCVFTFSGAVSGQIIVVEITNGGSGGTGVVTWPTVKWAGGVAPTQTVGTAALDVYTFVYNGSFYVGSVVQNLS